MIAPELYRLRKDKKSTTVVLHKMRALWTDAAVVISSRDSALSAELRTMVRPWPDPLGSEAERTLCAYLGRPESAAWLARAMASMHQSDRHRHLDGLRGPERAILLIHLNTEQQRTYLNSLEDPKLAAFECEHTLCVCRVLTNWPSLRKGFKNQKRALMQQAYEDLQISQNTGLSDHLRHLTAATYGGDGAGAKAVVRGLACAVVSGILTTLHELHGSHCVRKHLARALTETQAFLLWPCDPHSAHIVPVTVTLLANTQLDPLSDLLRRFALGQGQVTFLDTSTKGHGGKTVHAQQRLHNDNLPGTAVCVAPKPVDTAPSAVANGDTDVLGLAHLGCEAACLLVTWLGRVRIVVNTLELLLNKESKAVSRAAEFFNCLDVNSLQAVATDMAALVALLRSATARFARAKSASCRSRCQIALKAHLESVLGTAQLDDIVLLPFLRMLKIFWRQDNEGDRPSWYIDCFRKQKERIVRKLTLFQHSIPCKADCICSTDVMVQWGDLVNMHSEFGNASREAVQLAALVPSHLTQPVLGLVVPCGRWERALNALLLSTPPSKARDRLVYITPCSGDITQPVFVWYGSSAINVGLSSLDAVEHKKGLRLADCNPEERIGPRFRVNDRHREPGIILHTPQKSIEEGYTWTQDLIRLWDHFDGICESEALAIRSWSPLACRRNSGRLAHNGDTHLVECDSWPQMEGIGQLTQTQARLLMDAVTTDLVYQRAATAVSEELRGLVAYQYALHRCIPLPFQLCCLYTWLLNMRRHKRDDVFPFHVVSRQVRLVFALTGNVGAITELYAKRGCADQTAYKIGNKRRRWT